MQKEKDLKKKDGHRNKELKTGTKRTKGRGVAKEIERALKIKRERFRKS